jgi:hypothetical protein
VSTTDLRKSRSPAADQVFDLIASVLAEQPRRDRNEILAFLDFWRDLPREERALFAKSVKPDLNRPPHGREHPHGLPMGKVAESLPSMMPSMVETFLKRRS